jgi:hypothetical protein
MEKIQTAIQELISELKALKQTKVLMPSLNAIDDCINLAYAKIEVEKQQIIKVIRENEIELKGYYMEGKAEEYYNQTFKQ